MNDSGAHEQAAQAAVLETMALLSALSAAAEVYHVMAERKAGRDASAQEAPRAARAGLRESAAALQEMLARLRSSLAFAGGAEGHVAFVRQFDDLFLLSRIARVLHVAHQRLLSLYPGVSEHLLEEVRRVHGEAVALGEGEEAARLEAWTRFVERGLAFVERMAGELEAADPAG